MPTEIELAGNFGSTGSCADVLPGDDANPSGTVDPFCLKPDLNFPKSSQSGGVSMLPHEIQREAHSISMSSGSSPSYLLQQGSPRVREHQAHRDGVSSASLRSWRVRLFSSTGEVTVEEFLEEHVSPVDLRA